MTILAYIIIWCFFTLCTTLIAVPGTPFKNAVIGSITVQLVCLLIAACVLSVVWAFKTVGWL